MDDKTGTGTPVCATKLAHSEEHFGPIRNFWWNDDFLDLMARRWGLGAYRTLLDVGCGRCHWSRLLAPRLAYGASITAFDRDIKWASGDSAIREDFAAMGASVEFRHGDAHQLPFDDDQFDVVTCQTVLMHLADPLAALSEMKRVVRPGGTVICVEPNNLIQTGITDAVSDSLSIDELLAHFKYALLCERGKRAAGEGGLSLGDRLPRLFQVAGFDDIKVFQSDKVGPLLPPYESSEAQANLEELLASGSGARAALWQKQVSNWVAALGDAEANAFVESQHKLRASQYETLKSQVENRRYWSGGATMMYLVSAKKIADSQVDASQ